VGKGSQTIGHRYFMAKHDGLGRGPVNEFVDVQVGELSAYGGDPVDVSTDGALIVLNRPNLFGGKKKEGGIVGPLYILSGKADQVTPGTMASAVGTLPDMAATLGGDVPGFRGIISTWYDGEICSNNPYPKEWAYRLRRWNAGWYDNDPWYPVMALIEIVDEGTGGTIKGMNGSHILVECNTNPQWGRGMPMEMIDENSYRYAAHVLCNEGWALCFPWFRQESVRDFIQVVIDHIGGVQYVDRETGKMTLRLIRDDYDPDELPVFGPDSGLLDVQTDDAAGEETGFNEIIVKGFNPVLKKEISVRVQNIGAIQAQDGEIISVTKEYRGCPTEKMLLQIAIRELRAQIGLRKLTLEFDRRAWRLAPGMPIKINFPDKNIANMIVRPGEITESGITNGRLTAKAVEDVFGVPLTVYVDQPTDQWTPPDYTAAPPLDSKMIEANYRDVYLRTTEAERAEISEGDSLVGMVAAAPTGIIANGYDLATRTSVTSYPDTDNVALPSGSFTAWLKLGANLTAAATTATIAADNTAEFMTEFVPGMVAMIGDEHVEIVSVDEDALTAVIARGVADTIPAAHLLNDMIWLIDDEIVSDGTQYAEGETVYGKALTTTAQDALTLAEGIEKSVVTEQRVNRPYPPGNVRVDGQSIYAMSGEHLAFVLTWAHRDRLLQMDQVVDHTEGSVGPEPGTTYNIRVYAEDGTTELFNDNVGNVDTWDSSVDIVTMDTMVWVELESERDGLTSFQMYRFPVVLNGGWGYGWGLNWGGA
jgi:hypothetical protein